MFGCFTVGVSGPGGGGRDSACGCFPQPAHSRAPEGFGEQMSDRRNRSVPGLGTKSSCWPWPRGPESGSVCLRPPFAGAPPRVAPRPRGTPSATLCSGHVPDGPSRQSHTSHLVVGRSRAAGSACVVVTAGRRCPHGGVVANRPGPQPHAEQEPGRASWEAVPDPLPHTPRLRLRQAGDRAQGRPAPWTP